MPGATLPLTPGLGLPVYNHTVYDSRLPRSHRVLAMPTRPLPCNGSGVFPVITTQFDSDLNTIRCNPSSWRKP
jgi:hypothetical protein